MLRPALFEPAFEHRRVFARPDVLERLPDGGWRIVEVKSTVKLHEHFILDVALQLWVLRGAGLDVRDAAVLTLNRGYVHDGVRLDVDALFKLHPVFAKALALQERIGEETAAMQAMLARSQAPDIAPGRPLLRALPLPLPRALHPRCRPARPRHRRTASA